MLFDDWQALLMLSNNHATVHALCPPLLSGFTKLLSILSFSPTPIPDFLQVDPQFSYALNSWLECRGERKVMGRPV